MRAEKWARRAPALSCSQRGGAYRVTYPSSPQSGLSAVPETSASHFARDRPGLRSEGLHPQNSLCPGQTRTVGHSTWEQIGCWPGKEPNCSRLRLRSPPESCSGSLCPVPAPDLPLSKGTSCPAASSDKAAPSPWSLTMAV